MFAVLAVLAAAYATVFISIIHFNSIERSFNLNNQKNSLIHVSILPQGSTKHSGWSYSFTRPDGSLQIIDGNIYDVLIDNLSRYDIDDWYLTLNIRRSLYLNSAWAGTTTITQRHNGEFRTQTLDLRLGFDQDIHLYHIKGDNLLIPLTNGDSITYHPSLAARETPIPSFNERTGRIVTTIGFIFYNHATGTGYPQIANGTFHYHLHKKITDSFTFWILNLSLAVWISILAVLLFSENRLKELERQQMHDQAIINEVMECFTAFIDAKDSYTAGHSTRVAVISRMLAEELGLDAKQCREVYYCGMLHDSGKMGVPDQIITKPGKLTEDEYSQIKEHTLDGYLILRNVTTIPNACEVARHHHERYDGNGYPDKLKGNEISLYARIICVADSYDAMNSERCYGRSSTKDEIIDELKACSGTHFDPEIAAAMLRLIEKGCIPDFT